LRANNNDGQKPKVLKTKRIVARENIIEGKRRENSV